MTAKCTVACERSFINLTVYLAPHPLRGSGLVPGTGNVAAAARIPILDFGLGRANLGIFLTFVAAVAVHLLLWRMERGFQIRAVWALAEGDELRGHPHRAEHGARHRHRRSLCGSWRRRGGDGSVRQDGRPVRLQRRIQRDRGGSIGAQPPVRGRARRAGLRGLFSGAQEVQFRTDVSLDSAKCCSP